MASSGIGGQAVMEGVMMKNAEKYAVAVRKPNSEITVELKEYKGVCQGNKISKIPIIRGVVSFVDSLVLGMKTLTFSASFFEEEEASEKEAVTSDSEPTEESAKTALEEQKAKEKAEKKEKLYMAGTICVSIVMAVAIFMLLPFGISLLFQKFITSKTLIIILEGILRLAIFITYIVLISRLKDIQRVFMYHGAEHKCINCIEHGMELNVENVRKSSKEHKRCGTSFLFFVVLISIAVTLFIRFDSTLLRLLFRILLIPVVAGLSYEFIRLAGRSDNPIVSFFSKPGLWMQRLTTKEPEDDMIEVGIASVEAVFDWRAYLAREKEEHHDPA